MIAPERAPRQRLDTETRRQSIFAAAASEFRERPYSEVKVSDVAARAGASTPLVFRYFGTKAELYAAVFQAGSDELIASQRAAATSLPDGVPTRDRVRAMLLATFAFVADNAVPWSNAYVSGDEPKEALAVRAATNLAQVELLRELVATTDGWARHDFALRGYLWFVDGACLAWVRQGCPADQVPHAVEAALGALQGALGDWGN